MNTKSALCYIAANGGTMRAYRTYLEEHALSLPGESSAETIAGETRLLAQLSPAERLHRVVEYLIASPAYLFSPDGL